MSPHCPLTATFFSYLMPSLGFTDEFRVRTLKIRNFFFLFVAVILVVSVGILCAVRHARLLHISAASPTASFAPGCCSICLLVVAVARRCQCLSLRRLLPAVRKLLPESFRSISDCKGQLSTRYASAHCSTADSLHAVNVTRFRRFFIGKHHLQPSLRRVGVWRHLICRSARSRKLLVGLDCRSICCCRWQV